MGPRSDRGDPYPAPALRPRDAAAGSSARHRRPVVLLGSSWLGIVVAAGLGGLVGALLLTGSRVPPVSGAADGRCIFQRVARGLPLSRTGLDFDVAPSLIAPLVTLLPGALLTTAVIELSTGQMISGAGRLAAGAAQLVLLGLGILAAAALVGIPAFDLTATKPALGVVGPWLAVGVFGIGIVMNLCARPSSSAGSSWSCMWPTAARCWEACSSAACCPPSWARP